MLLGAIVAGIGGWSIFMTFATNQEKLSSSVFRSIVRAVRTDPELKEKLGDAIRAQPEWYFNGDPHVKGHVSWTSNPLIYGSSSRQQISQLQGNIDVSFRVKGSKGTFGFSSCFSVADCI